MLNHKIKILKKLVCLFCIVFLSFAFFLSGCKTEPTTGNSSQIQNIDWSKETNFKLDFNDPEGQIKNLKGNKQLIDYILNAVEKGAVPAFNYNTMKAFNKTQVDSIFNPIEFVTVYDERGFEIEEKEVQNELNRPAVTKFRVKQEWYFDEANARLESKVTGLAPLETIFNEDETVRGDLPLFWVLFD